HLGHTLASAKLAVSARSREQALLLLDQVLLREPDRHDSRRMLVRLALGLKRYDLALEHLHALQKTQPDNGEVEHLFGQWYETQGKYAEAAAWYRRAIEHIPQEIDNYVRLAGLLRRRLDPKQPELNAVEADKVMDRLVGANPKAFRAYLARWQYRKEANDLKNAAQLQAAGADVEEALRLAPPEAHALV